MLEGSVRKSGDTLRITAQLIRTSDSSHLWSQTYDRELDRRVQGAGRDRRAKWSSALKLKLLPGKQPDNTQRTRDPAAYEQYLIGLDLNRTGGRGPVEAALAAFQRAVVIDPGYANACARIGLQQAAMADFAETPAEREAAITQALAPPKRPSRLRPTWPTATSRAAARVTACAGTGRARRKTTTGALALEPNGVQA